MFRPFLNSLMLGSLFFPFIAIAGSTAQGGVIHFYGQIVEPACDVSTQSSPVEMNGNDSNLLIVFYVQIMPDDLVMQLHRF